MSENEMCGRVLPPSPPRRGRKGLSWFDFREVEWICVRPQGHPGDHKGLKGSQRWSEAYSGQEDLRAARWAARVEEQRLAAEHAVLARETTRGLGPTWSRMERDLPPSSSWRDQMQAEK